MNGRFLASAVFLALAFTTTPTCRAGAIADSGVASGVYRQLDLPAAANVLDVGADRPINAPEPPTAMLLVLGAALVVFGVTRRAERDNQAGAATTNLKK